MFWIGVLNNEVFDDDIDLGDSCDIHVLEVKEERQLEDSLS
jgi:hypothetical protein